jgi:hypothetical protein
MAHIRARRADRVEPMAHTTALTSTPSRRPRITTTKWVTSMVSMPIMMGSRVNPCRDQPWGTDGVAS